ncbi:dihydrofolate reductase family protein [Pseudophaeobacter arcticus]|jgi:dihydrofolate reductase|uniref:dihydrofolate reductase family protein n=1 Tax=Pseudophaeobacter arcticus TaxID=385492 RepID=UPI00047F7865|nr:dihydrofolate reductase family protein [Pseudophaeobacter arcticus]
MGKLIITEFMTLDGVVESPELWSLDFWSDEMAQFKMKELESASALLLGRKTYEGFAEAWPQRSGDPYSDKFNAMPKHVVASGVPDLSWNNSRLVEPQFHEAVKHLKENEPGDLVVHGSITLARELIRTALVDEICLLIYPVIRGEGAKLFDGSLQLTLDCNSVTTFGNGVIAGVYASKPTS